MAMHFLRFNFIQYGRHAFSYVLVQVTVNAPLVRVKLLQTVNQNPDPYLYSCLCERSFIFSTTQYNQLLWLIDRVVCRGAVPVHGYMARWWWQHLLGHGRHRTWSVSWEIPLHGELWNKRLLVTKMVWSQWRRNRGLVRAVYWTGTQVPEGRKRAGKKLTKW